LYTACSGGAPELPSVGVVLDRSIAGVSIGTERAQVLGELGLPKSRLAISLGGGATGQFARYVLRGAPVLVTYDAAGRLVSIQAYSSFFRTATGLGPGSSLAQVRGLRGFRSDYCELGFWNGSPRTKPRAADARQGADRVQGRHSGGFESLKQTRYFQTIKSVCRPYDGPKLAWYVPGSGCKAPDGSYWALQSWQRMLPNLGFKPWKPEQRSGSCTSRTGRARSRSSRCGRTGRGAAASTKSSAG
jgi:hypothetical protein